MSATQSKPKATSESVDAVVDRATELGEKFAENGRKVRAAYVDSYEKVVLSLLDSYETAANKSKVAWVPGVAAAHADFAREATKVYASAARELDS